MQISIKHNIKEIEKRLKGLEKEIPYAIAKGLTATAKKVKEEEEREITRVFNEPVARTKRSIYMVWATKRTLTATIGVVDLASSGNAPIKYLAPEVEGGKRNSTGFEVALRSIGMLGRNESAIPSRQIKKNKYGNVSKATYKRVLDQLKTKAAGSNSAFHKRDGKGRGIWQRKGRSITPLFIFVTNRPTYSKRLKFYDVAKLAVDKHLRREMDLVIDEIIKKSKMR